MESNRERFLRMAKETRAQADCVRGQLRKDCLLVASIWEAMAKQEAEREARSPSAKPPRKRRSQVRTSAKPRRST